MNFKYEIGFFAYMEFTLSKKKKESGDKISGVYKIVDTDKFNVLLKEEEIEIIVPKGCITKYEPIPVTV